MSLPAIRQKPQKTSFNEAAATGRRKGKKVALLKVSSLPSNKLG